MEPAPVSFRRSASAEPATLNSLSRAMLARAMAALDGGGVSKALELAGVNWPNDAAVPIILRAAVTPTSMSSTALVPVRQQFVEALRAMAAGPELLARAGLALSSFGQGTVSVPGFAPGESDFVGELAPIPVKQFVSSAAALTPYKLATIVVVSGELIEHSDAEGILRSALTESAALALDRVLFSNAAAVPGVKPAGLLNGIAALTPGTGGGGQDLMAADIAKLLTAIAPVAGAGFAIIASAAQAVSLQLRLAQQVPNVMFSSALAAGTVIAVAPQAIAAVLETPRIDSSIEATLHMDSAPAAIANGGGVAAPTRSLFQTNTVGLRMITPLSWALRSPSAVAWMSGVNW